MKDRKRQEWNDMLYDFIDSPQRSANHLVLGMNKQQRDQANATNDEDEVYTWV